jgi:Protein of unknown function (DUF1761)
MPQVNLLAVLVAALMTFLLGGLWYSKALFGNTWNREAGRPEKCEGDKGRHPAKVFGLSFLLALVAAYVFAMFLGPNPALGLAVGAGASAGACWVAASFGINYLFASRSLKLWLIDGGYHTVQFTLFGLVLGLWH